MVMKKEKALYDMTEEGALKAREVKLDIDEKSLVYDEYKDETVKITPIPRLELREIFDNVSKIDEEDSKARDDKYDEVFNYRIILDHCVNPKYTKEDLVNMRPALIGILVNTVLRESGLGGNKPELKNEKK